MISTLHKYNVGLFARSLKLPIADAEGRVVEYLPWEPDEYQVALWEGEGNDVVVKARQVGMTAAIQLLALHYLHFYPGSRVVYAAHGERYTEDAAWTLLRLAEQIGFKWRGRPNESSRRLVAANGSRWTPVPSTAGAGRGATVALTILDEFAQVPYADKLYRAMVPASSLGGRIIVASTPHGRYNRFYQLAAAAESGASGWRFDRVHWSRCPRYNPAGSGEEDEAKRRQIGMAGDWYDKKRAEFQYLGGDEDWAQEFECDFLHSVGLIYPTFDRDIHVCAPFDVPPLWRRRLALDHGFRHETAAVWLAADTDGHLYIYREYGRALKAVIEHAQALGGIERGEAVTSRVIDPSACRQTGQQLTVQQEYATCGLYFSPARADHQYGYARLRNLLQVGEDGKPGLRIFATCPRTIAQIEGLEANPHQPEDQLKVKDDFADAVRYGVAGPIRTYEPDAVELSDPDPWSPAAIMARAKKEGKEFYIGARKGGGAYGF